MTVCPRIEADYGCPPDYDKLIHPPPQAYHPTRVQAQLVELATCADLWGSLPFYRAALLHERAGDREPCLVDVLVQVLMNNNDQELAALGRVSFVERYHEVMDAYEDVTRGCP